MEVINWIEEENKGSWDNPNLVAYCLIEAMSEKAGLNIDGVFKPFNPSELKVDFKVNDVEVSFKSCMEKIQSAVAEIEADCKKSMFKDVAAAIIAQLEKQIDYSDL